MGRGKSPELISERNLQKPQTKDPNAGKQSQKIITPVPQLPIQSRNFLYSFPKRWAVSVCLTTNKTYRLSLLYLKQLTKPQAHSTYLSSLHSHHFSPWQACFFSDAILQIIKHSMFGSDLKPLLGFLLFFPNNDRLYLKQQSFLLLSSLSYMTCTTRHS